MTLRLVPAEPFHADILAQDVRRLDAEEWVAASGMRSAAGIKFCLGLGGIARSIISDTNVLTMHGASASRVEPDTGVAWLIATNAAYRNVHAIHHFWKESLAEMHAAFPRLVAWAYHKNTAHHRWMLRLGWERTGRVAEMGMGFSFVEFTHQER